ncbi:MAG TPA: hypothetical protein VGF56_12330 [Rhizomicrobium sp.]|jgi:hypothetical protein
MKTRSIALSLVAALFPIMAVAHGGGGGGGGGGGHHGGGGGGGGHHSSGGNIYFYYFPGEVVVSVPPPRIGDYSQIHTVAIVSAIGNTLELEHQGFLDSASKKIDISGWGIDAAVEADLQRYLAPRFAFKQVSFDRAAIEQLDNGKMASGDSDLREKLAAIPHDGIDAFIVVRPDVEGDMWGPQGLALAAPTNSEPRPLAWADYEIDIVDTHTMKTIGHASSRMLVAGGGMYAFPGMHQGPELALGSDLNPTPAQLSVMRQKFTLLTSLTLTSTVNDLGFNVPLPLQDVIKYFPAPPHFEPPSLTGPPRSVAVVSAIGDHVTVDDQTFNHQRTLLPTAGWNLDSEVEARLGAALSKRVVVKPAPQIDRAALARINLPITHAGLAMSITGLKPTTDVQAYVVVLKHQEDAPPGTLTGLTLTNHLTSGEAKPNVAASFAIAVVDARTLRPIWIQGASPNPDFRALLPTAPVDAAVWPKDGATLSPDQAAAVHQKAAALIGNSVDATIDLLEIEGVIVPQTADKN